MRQNLYAIMVSSSKLPALLPAALALVLLSATGTSGAAEPRPALSDTGGATADQYRLDSLTPASAPAPGLSGVARLGGGQEFLFALPASFGIDSLALAKLGEAGSPLDRPRATYRYTWFARPSWAIKIGLSTTLDPGNAWERFLSPTADHLRVGSLPSMHLSSQSRVADNWLLSVNAEGMRTARGQGLDMDLRVDYSLTRNVALFGSYRLTDSSGDVPEFYGFVPSNSARFGVRLRF